MKLAEVNEAIRDLEYLINYFERLGSKNERAKLVEEQAAIIRTATQKINEITTIFHRAPKQKYDCEIRLKEMRTKQLMLSDVRVRRLLQNIQELKKDGVAFRLSTGLSNDMTELLQDSS